MRHFLTNEEVECEISQLTSNPDVRLARAEARLKYKRRQHLYALRNLAKRGAQLREKGYTQENIREMADRFDDKNELELPYLDEERSKKNVTRKNTTGTRP